MIRKLFRRGLRIGAVVGAILFLVQLFLRRQQPLNEPDTSGQPPNGPVGNGREQNGNGQIATATKTVEKAWAEPEEGTCPDGYPVKAKIASGIFHVPGGMAYDRTSPDRCYRDAAAAEADGYRPAKR